MKNTSIGTCCDNIDLIKSTVEGEKYDRKGLALLLIVFGGGNFLLAVLDCMAYMLRFSRSLRFQNLEFIVTIVSTVLFVCLCVKMRKKRQYATLRLMYQWGVVLLIFPWVFLALQGVMSYDRSFFDKGAFPLCVAAIMALLLFSFFMALLFSGIQQEDITQVVAAILSMAIFFLIILLGSKQEIRGSEVSHIVRGTMNFLLNRLGYAKIFTDFVCLWVGVYHMLARKE